MICQQLPGSAPRWAQGFEPLSTFDIDPHDSSTQHTSYVDRHDTPKPCNNKKEKKKKKKKPYHDRPVRQRPRAITLEMDPMESMSGAPVPKDFNAEEAINMEETYWSILEKVKGSTLRLTKMDDDIYEHLKTDFPEFDAAATINEDEMKSKSGKERWRNFMMAYEKKIDDYNFGTMVRNNPKAENKQGLNDWIYEQAQAEKAKGK
ncbi:Protein PBDC1 [Purpureocillium lavendulum]|uniref:Protein PBDC1 n=1 Tax=Purpureocillium lavendulum TaxID=1247861 RepID=A0AB34FDJ9_9HYPO|nr:Protein PBDC1 [Purpureocillium lavendulum]